MGEMQEFSGSEGALDATLCAFVERVMRKQFSPAVLSMPRVIMHPNHPEIIRTRARRKYAKMARACGRYQTSTLQTPLHFQATGA